VLHTGYAGFGHEGRQNYSPFTPKKRIEIFAPDDLAEAIFATFMEAANTHQHGAGKVYILEVSEGGRIGSGERGPQMY
jgi:nitrogen regulatory protein PII